MIARLSGKVIEKEDKALIIDTNGIGYRVNVLHEIREAANLGEMIELRIYHHIADDSETLYGFVSEEHLKYFNLLLTVPSVGVRTAMNIMEAASPQTLSQAVAEQDMTLLTKVSGVGKKTAQRILIELKEKIKAPKQKGVPGVLQQETMEALVSIGYTPSQARVALAALPKEITTVEEAVRVVLQTQHHRK
jgi:holliday junction DNA helicase RuvA